MRANPSLSGGGVNVGHKTPQGMNSNTQIRPRQPPSSPFRHSNSRLQEERVGHDKARQSSARYNLRSGPTHDGGPAIPILPGGSVEIGDASQTGPGGRCRVGRARESSGHHRGTRFATRQGTSGSGDGLGRKAGTWRPRWSRGASCRVWRPRDFFPQLGFS